MVHINDDFPDLDVLAGEPAEGELSAETAASLDAQAALVATAEARLAELARLRAAVAQATAGYEQAFEQAIKPVAAVVAALKKRHAAAIAPATKKLKELEEAARLAALAAGRTVRGGGLMATYNRGKTSWNDAMLVGMAEAMPAILKARKMGDPYISISTDKTA